MHNFIGKIVRQVLNEEVNKEIMTANVDWMKSTYDRFNKLYWGGSLPSNLSFSLNGRLTRAFARACFKYTPWQDQGDGTYIANISEIIGIEFSTQNKGETWVFENVMMHEMIHIADFYFHPEHYSIIYKNGRQQSNFQKGGYNSHGDVFFMKEAQRLSQYGWNISKMISAEEDAAFTVSDEYIERKQKAKQAKKNKINKAYARWKQIRYTIDMIGEKSSFLNKYIANKTNNFTQPMPECIINVGQLKVIFSNKYDWRAQVLNVDKNDAPSIKYKAVIYIKDRLLSSIERNGLGTGAYNVDLSQLFEEDYGEMYDLEEEYGF